MVIYEREGSSSIRDIATRALQDVTDLDAKIVTLQTQREQKYRVYELLTAALKIIEPDSFSPSGEDSVPLVHVQPSTSLSPSAPMREIAEAVLPFDDQGSLTIPETFAAMKATGWQSNAKNPIASLNTALLHATASPDSPVVRPSRGRYAKKRPADDPFAGDESPGQVVKDEDAQPD